MAGVGLFLEADVLLKMNFINKKFYETTVPQMFDSIKLYAESFFPGSRILKRNEKL